MRLIKYNKKALNDMDAIFKIISEDKPTSAKEYVSKLDQFIKLLEFNPEMGIECRVKGINKDCRLLIYDNYMIRYKVHENGNISIIEIKNTKRSS